jgi:hypothetical protein
VGLANGEAVGGGVGLANGEAVGVAVGVAVGLYLGFFFRDGYPCVGVVSMYELAGKAEAEAVANSTAVAPVGKSV